MRHLHLLENRLTRKLSAFVRLSRDDQTALDKVWTRTCQDIAAQHDHIVPAAASKGIIDLVASTDKEEVVLKGGHVSLVAGGNAVYRLWPKLAGWLADRCT